MKLQAHPLALAAAATSAFGMLLLTVASLLHIYAGAISAMQKAHMFYAPTTSGTITGMIEAAVMTYIFVYVFAWVYNRLPSTK